MAALACFVPALGSARAGVAYSYDDLGRLTVAAYDNGKEIDYHYDQAGNRTSVVTQATTPHANARTVSKKKAKAHRR